GDDDMHLAELPQAADQLLPALGVKLRGAVVGKGPDDLDLRHPELAGQEHGHLVRVVPDGCLDSLSRVHVVILASGSTANLTCTPGVCEGIALSGVEEPMAEITLAKALKVKNRLAGRLAKVQADIQAYNSVPAGQADQVNVPALMKTRAELVGALVALKTAINDANREAQREVSDLAEKKATAQFLAGVTSRH